MGITSASPIMQLAGSAPIAAVAQSRADRSQRRRATNQASMSWECLSITPYQLGRMFPMAPTIFDDREREREREMPHLENQIAALDPHQRKQSLSLSFVLLSQLPLRAAVPCVTHGSAHQFRRYHVHKRRCV